MKYFPDGAKNSISPLLAGRDQGQGEDAGLSPARETAYPWRMVTGRDFGRAIKWSRERGNTLFEQIKKRIEATKK